MEDQDRYVSDELPQPAVFALDIGTRSIIGMVGVPDEDRIQIVAIERVEHTRRAMIDGQIENIDQVAKIAGMVKDKLEKRLGCKLTRVAVAAAGRALRTVRVTYEMELPEVQKIDAEMVSRLEAGAISEAEKAFLGEEAEDKERRFYLVGYSVCRYYLDNYIISSLIDHHGRTLKADIIATFLPSEVLESLYMTMNKIGLDVASLTLEPIAAINAAIPPSIRLLNLALVDIGAGTSDIAVCRDGCVTGYTMAIQAGDEITETIMKEYLVDFQTAEMIKSELNKSEEIVFTDIMGFEQTITREQLLESIKEPTANLCEEICSKIIEANGDVPSAVFLAGGGSQLPGLKEGIVERLHMDPKRVAIAGRNFKVNAYSEGYDLENPEYATPLGILISAGLNMINDSFRVFLNNQPAKLFRSGAFTVMNILMMNGYGYQDMMGRSGQNLVVNFNGKRKVFYGEKAEPCVLKMNGRDTQLSDLVRAGDQIEFTPVRHGKDAAAMLSQLVELREGYRITINGHPVESDVELKFGDTIVAEDLHGAQEEEVIGQDHGMAVQENGAGENPKPEGKAETRAGETAEMASGAGEGGQPEIAEDREGGLPAPPVAEKKKRTAAASSRKRKNPAAQPAEKKKTPAAASSRKKKNPAAEAPGNSQTLEPLTDEKAGHLEVASDGQLTFSNELAASLADQQEMASLGRKEHKDTQAASRRGRLGALVARISERREQTAAVETGPAEAMVVETGPAGAMAVETGLAGAMAVETADAGAVGVGTGNAGAAASGAAGADAGEQERQADGPALDAAGIPGEAALSQRTAVSQEPVVSQKTAVSQKTVVYLNEKTLVLSPKPDGTPYYLMDMLQYTDLDLKKLTSPVALEVNGEDGAFQQELKDGDHVRIYEQ